MHETNEILFVGDIHGCLEPLEALLRKAAYRPDRHRLIAVGDTINRGPHNHAVLQLLHRLGASVVRGNHEEGLLRALQTSTPPTWFDPARDCPDLLQAPDLDRWIEWIASWPFSLESPDWIVVHAGVHPLLPLEQTPSSFLTRVRICDAEGQLPVGWDGHLHHAPPSFFPWHHFYQGPQRVIYGHWARQGFLRTAHTLCLDGGCVYGKELIGWWFPRDEFVRVPGLSGASRSLPSDGNA